MYFKSVFLSIVCSAIAFTSVAQVPWLSTMHIKDASKVMEYLPPKNAWYGKGFNHSLYYCYNTPKKGARPLILQKIFWVLNMQMNLLKLQQKYQ